MWNCPLLYGAPSPPLTLPPVLIVFEHLPFLHALMQGDKTSLEG